MDNLTIEFLCLLDILATGSKEAPQETKCSQALDVGQA